ncbi:DUF1311 domain-containing protein [Xanthomonas euroxanthea]|uniref:DUF1311 domain-containing protein n=1 Tax=Xanthomonas euroxanthea TaxID=2259622 RepID=A0A8E4G9T5_9XANT|nr:lysozyme inhibitor LprI family protein [Xanthomonas euroxanthea]CAD1797582.1 DUF1311 domain-containing protein [Xanthomonas euroxanthea]SYZ57845.1 hypothetical protein CPBF367_41280 [Xanthomonas arboricola pv. juglandis]
MEKQRFQPRVLLLAALSVGGMSCAQATNDQRTDASTPKGLSTTYLACQKQARGAIEHAACVSQEETVQDRRLNKVYKQLLASLQADGRTKLVDAQRAWLLSRTKDGNLEAVIYGDSQPENIESAEAAMLRLSARADQLEKYLALIN